ncbi:MAG TPA: polysaccharide biosynthesis tyrosine autokinase, partial [Lamprocystis sp. (in: g-proteobacteria)]|nr:polysaccharide biosynthesis tyrosine autokinase [Lamprocystis sp. (in: g-proteobacteria)]
MKHPTPLLPLALPLLEPSGAGTTGGTGSVGGGLPRFRNGLIARRWAIAAITLIALALALPITYLRTPMYRGSVLIQIERNTGQPRAPETSTASADQRQAPDQTQLDLLRSRALARRAIDQLGLHLAKPRPALFTGLARHLNGVFSKQAANADPQDLESIFLANLRVTPIKDSSLVRIQFDSPRPDEAAAVANTVAASFISATRERADQVAASARAALAGQGRQIRTDLGAAERRLAADAATQRIIDPDDQIEILMNRLKDLSREQAATEAARIAAQAQHQQAVRDGPGRTAAALNSPVIQTLKEQQAELSAQYQEQLKVFKPGYPKMVQIKAQIAELERQIEREATRIGHAARSDYQAKARQETELAAGINDIKTEILALKRRGAAYRALQREVDTHRAAFAGLLERMKEVGANADRGAGTMAIVDAAATPRVQHAPNLAENLAIAIAIGLFGGAMLAALLESLDDTLRSSDEAEQQVGAPVFGVIPWLTAPPGVALALLPWSAPRGILAESFRSFCTALTLARTEGAPRVMHICSAAAGEGKTTAACAAAITFAQGGSKVLLIDGDLRNPSLHQAFGLPNTHGLTNCLTGAADPHQIAQTTAVAGLFVICSGPLPPNPVELLASVRMTDLVQDAARRFDHVILDGPPVVGLADALILAHLAGATLMVVASRATRAGALAGSLRRLRVANARILGAVLVKHRRQVGGYGPDDHLIRQGLL